MRILLTGGTGFIGSSFLRLAQLQGHRVLALHRSPIPGHRGLAGLDSVDWIEGSLADLDWKYVRDWSPECLLHAAWISTPGIYLEAPENSIYLEESSTFIREALSCGIRHVVSLGTCIEYRPSHLPLDEDSSPLDENSPHPYVRAKTALHRRLESFGCDWGASMAWARIFYPYGVGEHPRRFCSACADTLLRGQEVVLATPQSVKDYIHIDDVAAALLSLCVARIPGTFNVCSGSGIRIGDLALQIAELIGKPHLIRSDPSLPDPFPTVVGRNQALRQIGWEPRVNLDRGLGELVADLTRTT